MDSSEEQLANILMPYLKVFDEAAISHLATQLRGFGIETHASAVNLDATGLTLNAMLTFVQVPLGWNAMLQDPDTQLPSYCTPPSQHLNLGLLPFDNSNDAYNLDLLERDEGNSTQVQESDYTFEVSQNEVSMSQSSASPTRTSRGYTPNSHFSDQTSHLTLRETGISGSSDDDQFEHDLMNMLQAGLSPFNPEGCPETSEQERQLVEIHSVRDSSHSPAGCTTQITANRAKTREAVSPPTRETTKRRRITDVSTRVATHGNLAQGPEPTPPTISRYEELQIVFGSGTKHNLTDKMLLEILDICEGFIRPDLLEYLGEALPRWQKTGFWLQEELLEPMINGTGRAKLFNAYSSICRLNDRMADDQIRNRVALMMLHVAYEQACREWQTCGGSRDARKRKGRGDASSVIDDILEQMHDDWNEKSRKIRLRSKFHDKKRYGKRWLILTSKLGISLLIASSAKVASAVHNTVFTTGMLEVLGYCMEHMDQDQLRVLLALSSSAEKLLQTGEHETICPESIIDEIRPYMQSHQ